MTRKLDNFRYAIIPAGAITDPRVEPRALQVLCLLGRHANDNGWCRRSQVKMAEELNCGRATIQRALDVLVETGYVERQEEGRGNAKPQPGKQPFAAYSYRVRLDRSDKEVQEVIEGGAHERAPHGGCPPAGTGVPTQAGTGVPTSRAPLTEHTPIEDAPLEQTPALPRGCRSQSGDSNLFGESKPDKPKARRNGHAPPNGGGEVDAAFKAYEEFASRNGWSICQVRSDLRTGHLRKRLHEAGGIEGWLVALGKAEGSDFICGRAPPSDDRPPFKLDIDFLLQQKTFIRLMEGRYDNRSSSSPRNGRSSAIRDAARAAAESPDARDTS